MRFSEYMDKWLYGENGYYKSAIVGKGGDFFTAVSVSKFFGASIAKEILNLLESSTLTLPLKIVEIGSHHGDLIKDVYDFLNALSNGVMDKSEFLIIEPLKELQEIQKENLKNYNIKIIDNIKDLDSSAESIFCFCNELFDSFACEVFKDGKMAFIEQTNENLKIIFKESNVLDSVKKIYKNENLNNFSGIFTPNLKDFIDELVNHFSLFKNWRFVAFDYVQNKFEPWVLRGFLKHQVLDFNDISNNLDNLFGKCDLTYNVDFELLGQLFLDSGANVESIKKFSNSLIDFGILDVLESFKNVMGSEKYEREALKLRTLFTNFGEKFQTLVVSNGRSSGIQTHDLTHPKGAR